ncbi:hypothetical protein F4809DRAFT_665114 [Biscogniauxia mediterranea]|nr:hypothetical protein F4809DRAFT_665114 [Biscogniauxia mediterranea]
MCYINYYICSQCYHGYARFTNVCPKMHPPRVFCPNGTPFHIRIVDETACALYPYHAVPMHGHMMANINGGAVQAHDQSSQGTSSSSSNESQLAARTDKTGKDYTTKIRQHANQKQEPANWHNYGVYALGSQNQSFYPFHNTPMYPFYYGYSGDPAGQPVFQTPPPPPTSQLASPSSHHTQGSNQQTPLNPNAREFHSRMSPDTPSDEPSGHALEKAETGSKESLYNDKRGISRSVCNEDEYQPETSVGSQSTYTDKNTHYESPTPRASQASSSAALQPPHTIRSQLQERSPTTSGTFAVAVPLVPRQKTYSPSDLPSTHHHVPSRGHKETKSETDATVKVDIPLPSRLLKNANFDPKDHPPNPDSTKESPGLPTLEQHDEPAPSRESWGTEMEEELAGECKPTDTVSLFGAATETESHKEEQPEPSDEDTEPVETKLESDDKAEDPEQSDVPHTGGHPTETAATNVPAAEATIPHPRAGGDDDDGDDEGSHSAISPVQAQPRNKKKPRAASPESEPEPEPKPRKIFDETDFPALSAAAKARSSSSSSSSSNSSSSAGVVVTTQEPQHGPEKKKKSSRRASSSATTTTTTAAATIIDASAASADLSQVSSSSSPAPGTGSQPPRAAAAATAAVSWSSIVAGKRTATPTTPASSAASRKEIPNPNPHPGTPLTPIKSKTAEEKSNNNNRYAGPPNPVTTTTSGSGSGAFALVVAGVDKSAPNGPSAAASTPPPPNPPSNTGPGLPQAPRQPEPKKPKPQPQPRLWSQLVGGGGGGGSRRGPWPLPMHTPTPAARRSNNTASATSAPCRPVVPSSSSGGRGGEDEKSAGGKRADDSAAADDGYGYGYAERRGGEGKAHEEEGEEEEEAWPSLGAAASK